MNSLLTFAFSLSSIFITFNIQQPQDPRITNFESAFEEGHQIGKGQDQITFRKIWIGNLVAESGTLAVCDPLISTPKKILTSKFPKGEFAVELAIGRIGDDERVAFSRIVFSENVVARWEKATAKDSMEYQLWVDSGIGGFMDESTIKKLPKKSTELQKLYDSINQELTEHEKTTFTWALYPFSDGNIAAFSSGYGDGAYPVYIGYTADNKICRLLVDFQVVPK